MGKLKQIFRILRRKKDPEKQENARESAKVRSLQSEINVMEKVLDRYRNMVEDLAQQIDIQRTASMEDRLVEGLFTMFSGSNTAGPTQTQIQGFSSTQGHIDGGSLESGKRLSDKEIKGLLSGLDKKIIKGMANYPESIVISQVKKTVPGISDESIRRAIEISKEMV